MQLRLPPLAKTSKTAPERGCAKKKQRYFEQICA
jgi:hypothetical protein